MEERFERVSGSERFVASACASRTRFRSIRAWYSSSAIVGKGSTAEAEATGAITGCTAATEFTKASCSGNQGTYGVFQVAATLVC